MAEVGLLESALIEHAANLRERAQGAERAWECWLDTPAFARVDVQWIEERLHAQHVLAQQELQAFQRNPFAWVAALRKFDGVNVAIVEMPFA